MSLSCIFVYLVLFSLNLFFCLIGKKSRTIIVITSLFLIIIMCGKVGVKPVNGVYLDHFYYERDYNEFDLSLSGIDMNYVLYYAIEYVGHLLNMSYLSWSIMIMSLVILNFNIVLKRFGYNQHVFIAAFMFFIVALYASLKQLCAYSFFIWGISFLVRGNKGDRFRYVLFTILASLMHSMFVFYLALLLVGNKRIKTKWIFTFSFILSLFFILFGKKALFDIINLVALYLFRENSRLVVFESSTKLGWIIPIVLHLTSVIYTRYAVNLSRNLDERYKRRIMTLYEINLLCVLFYPLFIIALVFTRLITDIALVNFMVVGLINNSIKLRQRINLFFVSLISFFCFGLYFYGPCRFLEYSLPQLFTIYFFH